MHIKIFNDTQEDEINTYIHNTPIQTILATSNKIIIIAIDVEEVE